MMRKLLLLLVMCCAAVTGAWADEHTITIANAITGLSGDGHTYTANGITLTVSGGGTPTYITTLGSEKVTLPQNAQLIISSDADKKISQIVFSGYAGVEGRTTQSGAFTHNTFNGGFNAATRTWTVNDAFTNEHRVVLNVTGNDADDAVELTGSITVTYTTGGTAKTSSSMLVSETAFTIQPNYDRLAEPTVVITDNGSNNVTKYYNVNYYIQGQPTEGLGTNAAGREITTDPVTGSSVERIYGQFHGGSKAGTVTVMIVAVPKSAYTSQYDIVEGQYTVTISQITPTAGFESALPEGGITLNVVHKVTESYGSYSFTNSFEPAVALPRYTLGYTPTDGAWTSVLNYYDVSIEQLSDNSDAVTFTKTSMAETAREDQDSITVCSSATASGSGYSTKEAAETAGAVKEGANVIRYSFTPKTGYEGTYIPVTMDVTVTVIKVDQELELKVTLANDTISLYKYNNDELHSMHPDRLPIPTMTDKTSHKEYIVTGNPFQYVYKIIKDSTEYDDCDEENIIQAGEATGLRFDYNAGNNTHSIQTNKAGYTTIIVFPIAVPWASGIDGVFKNYASELPTMTDEWGNVYDKVMAIPDTFVVHTLKRSPSIRMRDAGGNDVRNIRVYQGQQLDVKTMYTVWGEFAGSEEYDSDAETLEFSSSTNPNGFWYGFYVKASDIKGDNPNITINNWPEANRIDTLKYTTAADGHVVGTDSVYFYHSSYGYNDAYNQWTITFNNAAEYPFDYVIHAWNHVKWDYNPSDKKRVTWEVVDQKKPVIVITPRQKYAKPTDGEDFDEPDVRVMYGLTNVTDQYNLTYAIKDSTLIADGTQGNATGTQIITASGVVTVGTTLGMEDVIVRATKKAAEDEVWDEESGPKYAEWENPDSAYYTIKISDDDLVYEIESTCTEGSTFFDATNMETNKHLYGKFHILGGTKLPSGKTIQGVPGMDIVFGSYDDDALWGVTKTAVDETCCSSTGHAATGATDGKRHVANGGHVLIDGDGIPTEGGYIVFQPYVNGYLTVDANWVGNSKYVLICKTDDGTIWEEDYTPSVDANGEYTFKKALIAGNDYYLYDLTNGDIIFHGANFDPSYVDDRNTWQGTEQTGTVFMNRLRLSMPTLLSDPSSYVTFASENTDYAEVVANGDGEVTPVAMTYGFTTGEKSRYVRIEGTVVGSASTCEGLSKTAKLFVFISDIPTYWVPDGTNPDEVMMPQTGDDVTTTNIATNIKMTFGGWKTGADVNWKQNSVDGWIFKGKADRIGGGSAGDDPAFNKMIDGFDCFMTANNNPRDEKGNGYPDYDFRRGYQYDCVDSIAPLTGDIYYKYKSGYTNPVSGTYLKFEPTENGTLLVYLVQNGCCDKTPTNGAEENYQIKWRPLYITDESGKPVEMVSDFGESIGNYLPSGNPQKAAYYTEGIYRVTINDATVKTVTDGLAAEKKVMKDGCAFDWSVFQGTSSDADHIIAAWTGKGVYDQQEIIKLSNGGYFLLSKAYVRYTFKVKAGKTYFVFQHGSKPELGGFSFVPDGFPTAENYHKDSGTNGGTLNVENTYAIFTTEQADYDFTLPNHKFNNGEWTSICLPFSVQEQQVKNIFGENTSILTCDSVRNDSLHFTRHAHQYIEAGRPYLIKPSSMNASYYDATNKTTLFKHVTIEVFDGNGDAVVSAGTAINPAIYNVTKFGDMNYVFKGLYKGENMPAYSYFVATTGLWRYKTEYLNDNGDDHGRMSYRAYFRNTASDGAAPARAFTMLIEDALMGYNPSVDEEFTTGIIAVDSDGEMTRYNSNDRIYNMQGVCVGQGAETINQLPQGIYIINGRRFVVK